MSGYRYFIALSSQFPFCGIPLRLDSYSRCQFSCRYCFASARGGASKPRHLRVADPKRLERRLKALKSRPPQSAIDELLVRRIPIHLGGMSDPFSPMERQTGTTLAMLRILREHGYPTLISTKGVMAAEPPYLDILSSENFVVQYSVTCASDEQSLAIDFGAPSTSQRFRATERLSRAGAKTTIRNQPLLPNQAKEAERIVKHAASAGASHISVEHLKLPIELDWRNRGALDRAAGFDLQRHYASRRSLRVGREWVLPVADRLDLVLDLKRLANRLGMTFGAADTDLLHFSDGNVCCSGADMFGLGDGFGYNFLRAVKIGMGANRISIGSLRHHWRPRGAIEQFVNSHSRLQDGHVEDFIRHRWNGVNNGPSPLMFYGIEDVGRLDRRGFKLYEVDAGVRRLHQATRLDDARSR
jgi:DNA repair photolyase